MVEKVLSQVTFEIGQINQLFVAYGDLLERVQQRTPDLIEVAVVASVLHSFYSGIENAFLAIAKGLDQRVPASAQWHRDLLVQMTQGTANRGGVISTELARKLADYLGFRHFYRHTYSFLLEWGELEKLVISLQEVWGQVKIELDKFLDSLRSTEDNRNGS